MSQETNAEALWKKLRSLYERKTAFIARKLVNLKLKGKDIAHALVIENRGRSKSRSSKG